VGGSVAGGGRWGRDSARLLLLHVGLLLLLLLLHWLMLLHV